MENGANETFDDKWDKKYWEEIMDKEDWMYDDDVPTFRFGELKDKYDTAIEKIKNDLKLKDIKEKMQEGAKDTAERVKNSDSAKIVQSIVEEITPKINEIKELIGYLDTIKDEIDSRNLESPEMEMYEEEIKELEDWQSLGEEVKQLVGEIAIDIGKTSLKGAGKLGKNIIGGTIIGAIRLGKNIKDFATGHIFKVKDPDSINVIKIKREDIKNKKDYEIIVDDEEYEEENDNEYFGEEEYYDGEYYNGEYYHEEDYDEEDYDDYNLEEIERDNFFKRTIKGIKALGQGIKKTYKSSKENYGKIKKQVTKTAKKVKDNVVNTAKNVKDDVKNNIETTVSEVKDTAKIVASETKDKYEVAKDKFNKRKNDALLDVLEASGKFAKKILEDIGNSIKSKTEKLEKANEKITQRSEAKKESEQRDEDTMEM